MPSSDTFLQVQATLPSFYSLLAISPISTSVANRNQEKLTTIWPLVQQSNFFAALAHLPLSCSPGLAFTQPDPAPVMKKMFKGEIAEEQHHAVLQVNLASMSSVGIAVARPVIAKAARIFFRSMLKVLGYKKVIFR